MCSRPIIYIGLCGSGERGPSIKGRRDGVAVNYYYIFIIIIKAVAKISPFPVQGYTYIDHDTVQRRSMQFHKDIATSDAAECFRAEHMYLYAVHFSIEAHTMCNRGAAESAASVVVACICMEESQRRLHCICLFVGVVLPL